MCTGYGRKVKEKNSHRNTVVLVRFVTPTIACDAFYEDEIRYVADRNTIVADYCYTKYTADFMTH